MLSDVLHDAEREIRRCQLDFPDTYGDARAEIDELRCRLNLLRLKYDLPFGNPADNPFYKAASRGDITPHDRFMAGESMEEIFSDKESKEWRVKTILRTMTRWIAPKIFR